MKSNYFLIFFLTFLTVSCVTKPVKEGPYEQAQWETKALIKNLKQNKNQSLSIDVYAVKNQSLRLEISALMGFQVASVVVNPSEISYINFPQKTFYSGSNTEAAISRVLNLSLHPMNLARIAFDEPLSGTGWKCSLDTLGLISQCDNLQKNINVKWLDRNNGKKKVVITAPQLEMQWHFEAPQTEVQFKEGLFTLKQPTGFKAIQIN